MSHQCPFSLRIHRSKLSSQIGFVAAALAFCVFSPLSIHRAEGEIQPTALSNVDRERAPDAATLRDAEKTVRASFAQDLSRKAPESRLALSRKLRKQSGEAGNEAAIRFVLLRDSATYAAEGGDYDAAADAINELAKSFVIDALEMKFTVLNTEAARPAAVNARELAEALVTLSDQASDAENFELGDKAARAGILVARRAHDAELVSRANEAATTVDKLKKIHAAADVAEQRLKTSPDDPQANLTVGRYLCFNRKRWDQGIPHLAKVSDPALLELAHQELGAPSDPTEMQKLGDAWWDFPDHKDDILQSQARARAVYWYELALPGISGLKKLAISRKIAAAKNDAPADGSRHMDLLPLIDVKRDTVHGDWKLANGELTCGRLAGARLNLPYHPLGDYDFHIEFTRTGGDDVTQYLITPKGSATWVIGAFHGAVAQFNVQKDPNPTRVNAPLVTDNKRCSCIVQVRSTGMKAIVDGKQVAEWKTDYSDFRKDPMPRLGLGGENSPTTFHVIEIIDLSPRRNNST